MRLSLSLMVSCLIGCGEQLIGAKEKLHKKYGDSQEQGCSSLDKVAAPIEADKLPSFGHEHRAIPFSSAKIKLQLFPLDEGIRIGLEQVNCLFRA